MSTNCVNCCINKRTGTDLLCNNCRIESAGPDLLVACVAGGLYSNALKKYQEAGTVGAINATDELERLFNDWHDLTHAAIAKAKGETQ